MYKLSLWEDNLDTSLEKMLTPLASSEVKAPTRAYNLILKHNINRQKTLTFEIFLKYFDISRLCGLSEFFKIIQIKKNFPVFSLIEKNSMYKWTCAVQTCVVQESSVILSP